MIAFICLVIITFITRRVLRSVETRRGKTKLTLVCSAIENLWPLRSDH